MKGEAKKNNGKKRSVKSTKSKPKIKKIARKKPQKNSFQVEKSGQYTKYEEFHIEKQLNKVFKALIFLSIILSILVILKNKDICMEVIYAKCGIAYNIVNNSVFFIFLWFENILAIVFCLYKIFCAIIDKNNKVKIAIVGIIIQPIIWENILKALNIL